jgi:spore maturation protein CgeB
MTRPTISFYGSSLVSAYWNGAATYYRGIIRALDARGYRVTFYEPDAYERQAHRDIADPANGPRWWSIPRRKTGYTRHWMQAAAPTSW